MEIIGELVRNIVVLLLVTLLLELLLPSGEMSRYVLFVMGLVLILMLINPIITLFGSKDKLPLYQPTDYTASTETILIDGGKLEERLTYAALSQHDKELSRQMEGMALLTEGVRTVTAVAVSDNKGWVLQAQLKLVVEAGGNQAQIETKVKTILTTFFGVKAENISLEIKEGTG